MKQLVFAKVYAHSDCIPKVLMIDTLSTVFSFISSCWLCEQQMLRVHRRKLEILRESLHAISLIIITKGSVNGEFNIFKYI